MVDLVKDIFTQTEKKLKTSSKTTNVHKIPDCRSESQQRAIKVEKNASFPSVTGRMKPCDKEIQFKAV